MSKRSIHSLRGPLVATVGIALAILVFVLGHASGRADGTPLSISISGNHFVNGSGQTIRLLGVDHASSEYACVDGYGYNDGHQDDADVVAVASGNATAVRIPLNEDCWLGINGQPNNSQDPGETLTKSGYRQAVEAYVAALNAHGIYAILDLHWTAPGNQVAEEQQPMPDNDHSPAFWQSVASTFKGNPAVVFDLFNEPYDPTDQRSGGDKNASDAVTWDCWESGTRPDAVGGNAPPVPCFTQAYDANGNPTTRYQIAGMQTLLTDIRGVGATQPIMVGGLDYADDLGDTNDANGGGQGWMQHAPADPLNQEAASFHNYMGKNCDDVGCWNSAITPVAANVPVVTGEFDEDNFDNPSCNNRTPSTFDSDYMNWADQNGVSYLAWGWEVLSADEISEQKCSAFYLTSDPSGTPAAPNGTALHDHLLTLPAGGVTGTTGGGPPQGGTTGAGTTNTGSTTSTTSSGVTGRTGTAVADLTPPTETIAQKLAKALKACKKEKPRQKRLKCEQAARKKYKPKPKKKHREKKKSGKK
jgi:hypothetical protein